MEVFTAQLNEAGKLRMYSQRIALLASTCGSADPELRRRCESGVADAVESYEANLAAVKRRSSTFFLSEDLQRIRAALQRLEADWDNYRTAALQIANAPLAADRETAGLLSDSAGALLFEAEALVELLLDAHRRAEDIRDLAFTLTQLLGLLLLITVAAVGYRHGIKPVREIVALARQTSRGNYQGRVRFAPKDEIGELAYAFNEASLRTEQLIGDLGAEAVAAQREKAKSDNLLESAADGIIICQLDGTILRINREAERIFGYRRDELISTNIRKLVPERFRQRHDIYHEQYAAEPNSRQMGHGAAIKGRCKDGHEIPLEISLSPSTVGDETRVIAVVRDASERERAAADIARLIAILDATPDVTATFTTAGALVYLNPAGMALCDVRSAQSLSGLRLEDMLTQESRGLLQAEAVPVALEQGDWSGEMVFRHYLGHEVAVSLSLMAHPRREGEPQYLSLIARDISARKQQELELTYRATHDSLTGLANRVLFRDRLSQALLRADRNGTRLAVLFIDLDNFKPVNDRFGHAAGDRLLQDLAGSLVDHLRGGDTKARLGGDEFAVILEGLESVAAAEEVVTQLANALKRPVGTNGNQLVVTTSIGVSIYPDHATDAPALLLSADAAMYQAKAGGRNTFRLFSPGRSDHSPD